MEYSDDLLRDALPQENPPLDRLPPGVRAEIGRWRERSEMEDPGLIARSTLWTHAIFSELSLRRYRAARPRSPYFPYFGGFPMMPFERLSFGLLPKLKDRDRPRMALILDVPRWFGDDIEIVDDIYFYGLGEQMFPLVLRQSSVSLHCSNPDGAVGTCWGQSKTTKSWGIVTAGHAVEHLACGWPVPLDDGTTGILDQNYYQPVDAAFVTVDDPPVNPTPLPVLRFPGVGMPVTVHTPHGIEARQIVEVSKNRGVVHTRNIGVLNYLNLPLTEGDSGSLVRLRSGEAVGIYVGELNTAGGLEGLAQNFEQAMFALDVNPYL